MTPYILAALGLWFVQNALPTAIRYISAKDRVAGVKDALGGRDAPPSMPVLGARAQRAHANLLEGLLFFLPLALLLEMKGLAEGLPATGALVWVVARVLYVPAYLTAVPGVRTVVWLISLVGLGMMTTALL